MKCSITSVNVKILSRAFHSLAKIGDELHVDPQKDGLSFRTVNASKSAYAEFIFRPTFFTSYRYKTDGTNNDESSQCKIAMRSCMAVFRAGTDKNTESCALCLDPAGQHLVIEVRCRNGRRETHHLPVIETDGLVAVFDQGDSPNQLVAEAKVWVDAMHNFQSAQDEVTLTAGQDRVTLSSYSDQLPDPSKVVRTELCLRAGEFDTFDVTEEATITFKLKDLRSMLAFGDCVSLPITMNFDSRGKPVVFMIKKNTFGATFVLATLSPPSDTQTTGSQGSALVVTTPTTTKRASASMDDNSAQQSKRPSIDINGKASGSRHNGSRHLTNGSIAAHSKHLVSSQERSGETSSVPVMRNRNTTRFDPSPFEFNDRAPSSKGSDHLENDDFLSDLNFEPYDLPSENPGYLPSKNLGDLTSENPGDLIPGTPPPVLSERTRTIFQRCFEDTFDVRLLPGYDNVLVEENDNEGSQ